MTAGALASVHERPAVPVLAVILAVDLGTPAPRPAAHPFVAAGAFLSSFLNGVYRFDGTFRRPTPTRGGAPATLRSVLPPRCCPGLRSGIDFSYVVQEQADLGRGNNYVLGRLNTEGVVRVS
jgi:hypothetical protein